MVRVWYVEPILVTFNLPLMHKLGTPDGSDYAKHSTNPETAAIYEEDIGLNEHISQLPGTSNPPTSTNSSTHQHQHVPLKHHLRKRTLQRSQVG